MASAVLGLGLAAAPSAAAAPVAHPAAWGFLDDLRGVPGGIHVRGWTLDPARPAAVNSLDVVVDGRMAALPLANQLRPDVNRVMRVPGNHGFDLTVRAAPGWHLACVVAEPVAGSGGTWAILGCRAVIVARG